MLTYQQLKEYLKQLSKEQLGMNVTVFCKDTTEYYPIDKITINTFTDILDSNHPYLITRI